MVRADDLLVLLPERIVPAGEADQRRAPGALVRRVLQRVRRPGAEIADEPRDPVPTLTGRQIRDVFHGLARGMFLPPRLILRLGFFRQRVVLAEVAALAQLHMGEFLPFVMLIGAL